MKKCVVCGKLKRLPSFSFACGNKSQARRANCKECHAENVRKRYLHNRGKCMGCAERIKRFEGKIKSLEKKIRRNNENKRN